MFVAGRYDQAANEYQVALYANPDDHVMALSRVRALYYAASEADTEPQRALFGQQALDTFLTLGPEQTMTLPIFIQSDPAFQQYIEELRIRMGQQDD